MELKEISKEEIQESIENDPDKLRSLFKNHHPADLAQSIRELELEEQIQFLTVFEPPMAGQILSQLQDISDYEEFVLAEKLPFDFLVEIIDAMPTDNAVDALNTFRKSLVADILKKLPSDKSEALDEMLMYGHETAGGLMTDDFLSLPETATVAEAKALLKSDQNKPKIFVYRYIYVTDSEERLVGILPIIDLLVHPDSTRMSDIMTRNPQYVLANVDQEEVARIFTHYDLVSLPVLNRASRVIGRITVDDVINVINEEADEDFYKLVGSDDLEKKTLSPVRSAMIRLPWLLSTLFGSFLSCSIIKIFSVHLTDIVALFFFTPVITAMSGNIGVQCSTLMVRGLATGFVDTGISSRIIFKELKVGFLIACICAVLSTVVAFVFVDHHIVLGVTVGLSMLVCMIFATITGTFVPLLLKRFGFDPAIASGPIITTFNDFTGLAIYFSIALVILL